MNIIVKLKKLEHAKDLALPHYASLQSAGLDLLAAIDKPITLKAGQVQVISTGIAMELPIGFEAQVRPRSGLAAKHGITVLNSPGTIDADYRGEIKVILINHSKIDFIIERGMRIAQIIIASYKHVTLEETSSLNDTQRGIKGFGSTGH